jgi:predicted CopG family antitoxin
MKKKSTRAKRRNIQLDAEAYRRLSEAKQNGETLSDVIRRLIPAPIDFDAWMKEIEAHPLSKRAAKAIMDHIERRGRYSTRSRILGVSRYRRAG